MDLGPGSSPCLGLLMQPVISTLFCPLHSGTVGLHCGWWAHCLCHGHLSSWLRHPHGTTPLLLLSDKQFCIWEITVSNSYISYRMGIKYSLAIHVVEGLSMLLTSLPMYWTCLACWKLGVSVGRVYPVGRAFTPAQRYKFCKRREKERVCDNCV